MFDVRKDVNYFKSEADKKDKRIKDLESKHANKLNMAGEEKINIVKPIPKKQ